MCCMEFTEESQFTSILRDFFERVRKANLCLRPSKCKVGFDQVKFLGHTLQGGSIKPQDESCTLPLLASADTLMF